MVDLSISALVTREALTLADLDINTGNYRLAGPATLGGNVAWDRTTVSSPVVDGDITVHRRRTNVTEQIVVYVSGADQEALWLNIRTLVEAFSQDRFTFQLNIGSAANQWDCEAADYSVQVDTPHMVARYAQVTFNVPRKPIPLGGGY